MRRSGTSKTLTKEHGWLCSNTKPIQIWQGYCILSGKHPCLSIEPPAFQKVDSGLGQRSKCGQNGNEFWINFIQI